MMSKNKIVANALLARNASGYKSIADTLRGELEKIYTKCSELQQEAINKSLWKVGNDGFGRAAFLIKDAKLALAGIK